MAEENHHETDDKYGNVQEKMNDAISSSLGGDFILKWVSLVEVIDSDGDRALWAITSDECQSWDILGMLQWGIQHEQAGKVTNMFINTIQDAQEEDDD